MVNKMLQPRLSRRLVSQLKRRSQLRRRLERRQWVSQVKKQLRPERYERSVWFRAVPDDCLEVQNVKWYAVDVSSNDDDMVHTTTPTSAISTNLSPVSEDIPSDVLVDVFVCLDSTIYSLGGSYRCSAKRTFAPRIFSNVVRCCDTAGPSPRWKNITPMNVGRDIPDAVVLHGKLYVMGGNRVEEDPESQKWAEVFDPNTEKWTFLPKLPCDDEETKKKMPSSGFVCEAIEEDSRKMLFVAHDQWKHVYLFDVDYNDWTRYPVRQGWLSDVFLPSSRNNRAFSGNTFYWYHEGCNMVSAYDLKTGEQFSGMLRGLPLSAKLKLADERCPCQAFFFHLAANLFCLFWGKWPTLHCTKFAVAKKSARSKLDGSLYAWVLSSQAYDLGSENKLFLSDAVLMNNRCAISFAETSSAMGMERQEPTESLLGSSSDL